MVEFADHMLPIQYSDMGILASHMWTRTNASLFDVSHMLQTKLFKNHNSNARWTGVDRVAFIESLVVSDIASLPTNTSTLSLFTTQSGGILDDTVITKKKDSLYVVTNAGCAEKEFAHIKHHLSIYNTLQSVSGGTDKVVVEIVDNSLIALQGPLAVKVLNSISSENLDDMLFMQSRHVELGGFKVQLARGGYTGEDGFEISVEHKDVEALCELLVTFPEVRNAGLGARDSLRLEAGMCLYGHDIDGSITPIEAGNLREVLLNYLGLGWTISKRRRDEGGFLGADKILPQIKGGVEKRRVGITVSGAPAREGAEIFSMEGAIIGKVTSGIPSPMLKVNIGMAYVQFGFHKAGTNVQTQVRNKMQSAKVVKLPFVPAKYHR